MDGKGRRSEMRFFLSVGLASTAGAGLLLAWSCGSTDVTCEDLANCPKLLQDAGTEERSDAADSSEAEAAVEVEADVACTSMLPPTDGGCLNESLAIFVSPKGNDSASGKRGAELRTIGAALRASKAGPKRIYVCDDGTGYPESLLLDASTTDAATDTASSATIDGVSLYGGFD